MKRNKNIFLLFTFCLLTSILQPSTSFAWGPTGHRIVGEIANRHLTKKAKKAIGKILGSESLAMCSNWPDFIKSNPGYNYTSVWHYINLPENITSFELAEEMMRKDSSANAYNVINKMVADLKNSNTSQENKLFALRFLVHVVGDIHQPMHCGRKADQGGNAIKVEWFNKPSNLHSVWDYELVDFQKLSYTEYATALDHASQDQLKQWYTTSPAQWIWESYGLSSKIYQYAEKEKNYSYRYNYDFVDTLNTRLLMGGIRLADVLNEIYK